MKKKKVNTKKEFEFLRIIRKHLENLMITEPKEYNEWLDCYYKVRKNILDYKI